MFPKALAQAAIISHFVLSGMALKYRKKTNVFTVRY